MRMLMAAAIVLVVSASGACDSKQPASAPAGAKPGAPSATPAPTPPAAAVPATRAAADGSVTALGVTLPLPQGWKSVPPSNSMRLAEVRVPDATGNAANECVIALSSAGGTVEGNITRWEAQVQRPAGAGAPAAPVVITADGMRATVVEYEGAYAGMGEGPPKPDWMLRGAIVETPQGLLFVKMTGPTAAMRAAGAPFMDMISGLKKQ